MATPFHLLLITIAIVFKITTPSSSLSSSSISFPTHVLPLGSSLFVDNKDDILVSPNGLFTAGFHQVGDNAYVFAVWFSEKATSMSRTVVWMANRDVPVNEKQSKLSIWRHGNLVLTDAGQYVVWSTQTNSTSSSLELQLYNTGNLVLCGGGQPIWQSFHYPTDTLLPNQIFTKNTQLVSSRSSTDHSSGFYKLFFDNDSVLRLLYHGQETTTVFWPHPGLRVWEVGRFLYIESRNASFGSDGEFNSSDGFSFTSADYGMKRQRMMRIDTDGNLRVYSLTRMRWEVQWQALSNPCKIHGTCGPNSLCTYSPHSGRKCACLYGYTMVNSQDWSYGCEPEFKPCIQENNCEFVEYRHVEFYGYDVQVIMNYNLDACRKDCLDDSTCKGFQFGWRDDKGSYFCFIKSSLHNGYQMGFNASMYIKLPKRLVSSFHQKTLIQPSFNCASPLLRPLLRSYKENQDHEPLTFLLVFGCMIGIIEIICVVIFLYCINKHTSTTEQSYFPTPTTFQKFRYRELKKASCNFSEEIGRGGASIVYKGKLADHRIVAIKKLTNTNGQGEDEFQAEISILSRVNHMNLIETWGYCAEGKHRLMVYEYMENRSLAENLELGKLDWATRFDIIKGVAKGLAYLHEECLEWVLHCDVKPHNILLDANYNPKVADFGLSKLLDRGGINQLNFSMMRGTRGYMAPEWALNLPITSKVDVFSYGVVILEMITGRIPTSMHEIGNEKGDPKHPVLKWVRDRIQVFEEGVTESWVDEIVDPSIRNQYNQTIMEGAVRIALHCVEEDKEARPSMSKVLSMLLHI